MQLSFHLVFNGQCEAAFRFYERVLGGKLLELLTYGNSPMAEHVPPDSRDNVVHATLAVGETVLAGADVPPDQYKRPQGFYVLLSVEDPAEADRLFSSLGEDGQILMPIQQTFWSSRFGVLVDQFGTPWEINCEAGPPPA